MYAIFFVSVILGALILVAIYIAMSYDNGAFKFYPCDLIDNAAHYSSFFAGIIVTLLMKVGQSHKKEKTIDI